MLLLLLLLLLWALPAVAQVPTTCPALRQLTNTVEPVVRCNTGLIVIPLEDYNLLRLKGAPNPAMHCTDGTKNARAGTILRVNTASRAPEPCDVFSNVPGQTVAEASFLRVVYRDHYEYEFFITDFVPVWDGDTLLGFAPPVPDLIVETLP